MEVAGTGNATVQSVEEVRVYTAVSDPGFAAGYGVHVTNRIRTAMVTRKTLAVVSVHGKETRKLKKITTISRQADERVSVRFAAY